MDTRSISKSKSIHQKDASPARSLHLWRLTLMAALLLLGGLIIGSRILETTPPLPTVTYNSSVYLPLVVKHLPLPTWARTYYVDSSLGNDGYNCTQAQNPATPKRTVAGILACNPSAGQTVRIRGDYTDTIIPTRSGTVLYNVQDIADVNGSVVTFNQAILGIYPPTDYVTIYGSRSGNSGAFAILSVSGNSVTVDTADLPGGQFIPESASDPGDLQAAILRPVHFTAWEEDNPPVFIGQYQAYHAINQRVIMVSHIKSIAGEAINPGWPVWPAIEIDGNNSGNSDFQIFDHLEVTNAECAIAIEAGEFQSNYDILQHNYLHDLGTTGNGSDEIIYWGYWGRPDLQHDFVQIMYNRVGPHNSNADLGDGIDFKQSAHNGTIFGNEIMGINAMGCSDSPIKIAGPNAFIANNYLHDINPQASPGCGISIVDDEPLDPTSGGAYAILINNIVADVRGVGIAVVDATGIQILNNTVYNIFPEPNCDPNCMEYNMGIRLLNWQGPIENMIIQNNIVHTAYIGIGRYIGSHDEFPVSIYSDYNLVFNTTYPFRGTIPQNIHDLVMDPGLVDPLNNNFALMSTSPGRDSGTSLASVFSIDNQDAVEPSLPDIAAPVIRTGIWDRGAFEYVLRNGFLFYYQSP